MDAILAMLHQYEPSPFERVVHIYIFAAVGVVVGVQISQYVADRPARWAVAHPNFWRIIHVFLAWLTVQICYRHWLPLMQQGGYLFGYEQDFLSALWLGLLGLEVALAIGGVVKAIVGSPTPKIKDQ